MKRVLFLSMALVLSSCATVNRSDTLPEDQLFQTRKYVGAFVEYRHVKPEGFGSPHLVWIKTTEEDVFGKICVYSRKCEFIRGERIYIRRIYYSPSVTSGYWMYQLEGDEKHYRLRQFQIDRKMLVQSWF